MKITNKGKKSIIAIIVFIVFVMVVLFILPSVYENNCKTRVYSDLEEKLDSTIISANITIMMYEKTETGNVESDSCEYIGTGVIIDSDEEYYYALTAAHVVSSVDHLSTLSEDEEETETSFTCYYVLDADAPTLSEAREASEEYLAIDEYCASFPVVEIEYISENHDIAILKFHSDEELTSLNLAADDPEYDDRIIAIGENQSVLEYYYGKITSKSLKTFQADGRTDQVLYANAYVIPGFSGGAVLNENMEIAGMIEGGGTDFLGRFRYGAILPASIISDEIEQWKAE